MLEVLPVDELEAWPLCPPEGPAPLSGLLLLDPRGFSALGVVVELVEVVVEDPPQVDKLSCTMAASSSSGGAFIFASHLRSCWAVLVAVLWGGHVALLLVVPLAEARPLPAQRRRLCALLVSRRKPLFPMKRPTCAVVLAGLLLSPLGLAAAAAVARRVRVCVPSARPLPTSPHPPGGVPGCLGVLWACGLKPAPGTLGGHSRCGRSGGGGMAGISPAAICLSSSLRPPLGW